MRNCDQEVSESIQGMAKECPWDRSPGVVTPGVGWAVCMGSKVTQGGGRLWSREED